MSGILYAMHDFMSECVEEEVSALIQALCFSFGIDSVVVHLLGMNSRGP